MITKTFKKYQKVKKLPKRYHQLGKKNQRHQNSISSASLNPILCLLTPENSTLGFFNWLSHNYEVLTSYIALNKKLS